MTTRHFAREAAGLAWGVIVLAVLGIPLLLFVGGNWAAFLLQPFVALYQLIF